MDVVKIYISMADQKAKNDFIQLDRIKKINLIFFATLSQVVKMILQQKKFKQKSFIYYKFHSMKFIV